MYKIFCLILLFLFCTVSYAATICYYVDPGAAGTNDGGRDGADPNDPSQEENWTNAFTSFSAGEAAVDGIAVAGNTYRFYTRSSSGTDDTTYVEISGWTDANIPVELYGYDFPTDGKWDGTKYVFNRSIDMYHNHLKFYRIQFENDATGTTNRSNITVITAAGGSTLIVDSCIFKNTGNSTGTIRGISVSDPDVTVNISNSIFTGYKTGSGSNAIINNTAGPINIYNCIVTDNYYGIHGGAGTITATNCAIFNNTDDIYNVTITYCAGDDADFDSGTGNIGWTDANDWNANFIDYTTGNFTPILDSQIYHTGTNLSLTTALNGVAWDNPPSIGAFEYVAGAPAVKKPRIININMN